MHNQGKVKGSKELIWQKKIKLGLAESGTSGEDRITRHKKNYKT